MVQVDTALCTGCGACVQACPEGAVLLANYKAAIDDSRCPECGDCIDLCPAAAITAAAPLAFPWAAARPARLAGPVSSLAVSTPRRDTQAWAAAGWAFLERWLMPRAAEILGGALERRVARPTPAARPIETSDVMPRRATGRGRRHRVRRRGL